MSDACIVEVALNGSTTTLTNPNVPRTPSQITAEAIACIDRGATIVHNHNDEGLITPDGAHSAEPYLEAWRAILAARPDALLYPTMASGAPGITPQVRWAHHLPLVDAGLCGMGLIDPGSVSLGLLDADGQPMALDLVYINTHADARYMVEMCQQLGLAPSISIFDPSFLRVALAFHEAGALPPGTMIKLYFGGEIPFGLPPTSVSLDAYVAMLAGSGLPWLVAVLAGDVIGSGLARAALERGGHVRVGLEDFLGSRTPTNTELMDDVTNLIDECGRTVATPRETREILGMA